MIRELLALALALFASAAFAAVDVNKADQAQLESIKGIGPAISGKILDERKKGAYKDWPDLIERVKGVGEGNAAKFSAESQGRHQRCCNGRAGQCQQQEEVEEGQSCVASAVTAPRQSANQHERALAARFSW